MEGMAVAVRETRKCHPAQDLLTGSRLDTDPNARETPLLHIKAHACLATVRQPGVRRPVRAHCSAPARSASTVVRRQHQQGSPRARPTRLASGIPRSGCGRRSSPPARRRSKESPHHGQRRYSSLVHHRAAGPAGSPRHHRRRSAESATPRSRRARAGDLSFDLRHGGVQRLLPVGSGIEPGGRRTAMAFTPPGWMLIFPTVARLPCAFGSSTRCQHGARTADHCIPAIAQPGGAGVVGLTRNLDPPPTVRPEPVANRDGTTEVDSDRDPARRAAQRRSRCDQQSPDPRPGALAAAQPRGSPPPWSHRQRHAVPAPVRVQCSGDHP